MIEERQWLLLGVAVAVGVMVWGSGLELGLSQAPSALLGLAAAVLTTVIGWKRFLR